MTTSQSATSRLWLSQRQRAAVILQSKIRSMSLECDRVGGINLSHGVCDTPVPVEVKQGTFDGLNLKEGFP